VGVRFGHVDGGGLADGGADVGEGGMMRRW
jgi:hypothetical protein